MLQGMERWPASDVTGKDTDRNSRGVARPCTAATAGSGSGADEERDGLKSINTYRSRSLSLPAQAQSQTDYLDSLRALAYAYSSAEQHRSGGDADVDPQQELAGRLTRQRSATMIDTNRNRMDSELTSDSDRTFDLSPAVPDPGDVFAPAAASEDEKARIISRRLHELDSAQRSWKKRVADYVHGLPATKPLPGEGGRGQDPKRRRLWSTGCERLPWEINSSDGVTPRQRLYTVSSDSTFSCSQLSTSSSRDSIQHWVDSLDGPEDLDATVTPGQANVSSSSGNGKKTDTSQLPAGRKVSDPRNGLPKPSSSATEDELGLGADAESVTGSTQEEDSRNGRNKRVIGPGGKMLSRSLTNSDIINMATQTRALQSRRKQLQRMGSSTHSDESLARVSDLLFARNDPEELLLNLGFGGGKEADPLERIPARFLQKPSTARGISINNYLALSETQDQKYGFSLHGGLRGLGAVLQNSMCAVQTNSPPLTFRENVSRVLRQPAEGPVKAEVSSESLSSVKQNGLSKSQDWLLGGDEELQRVDVPISEPLLQIRENNLVANGLVSPSGLTSQTKDVSDRPPSAERTSTSLTPNTAGDDELSAAAPDGVPRREVLDDPANSDLEEVDPGEGSSRSPEDLRRVHNARMVMPEPLLPPVHEELETTPTAPSDKPQPNPDADVLTQDTNPNAEEELIGEDTYRPTEGLQPGKQEESGNVEKKTTASSPAERALRLTHTQESFEIEEISSTENQDEGYTATRVADKPPEKGALVRTDSAQSDSSGFADEVMDTTYTSNSPCMEDCNEQGSPQTDYTEGSSRPEVGNKLIQTSFDDFGVLESFDRDECPVEARPERTATSFESDKSSSLSSTERIARSRKSFRESRSSYERMGSTFSGISISSLEDSPFDEEGAALTVGSTPIPRQRSGTYPGAAEKQEPPAGPKTVVEILTTLQENIKQATEAKNLIEDESKGNPVKKRLTLSKIKSVDFDRFSVDDVPSLMESVDAIVGRTKQPSASLPDKQDTSTLSVEKTPEDVSSLLLVTATKNGVVEESVKPPPKLIKRKSSQISMVPTLPCLDEEKTPAHSRHSSVTDTLHAPPMQNSNHSADSDEVQDKTQDTDQASVCTADGKSEEQECVDSRSDTDTPVSMIANADSIGDVGDLEEEMRYLEQVESLLKLEGRLLEEAYPPRFHARPKVEEVQRPVPEKTIVPDVNSELNSSAFVTFDHLNQSGTTTEASLSKVDQLSCSRPRVEESLKPFQEDTVVTEVHIESNSQINPSTFLTTEPLNQLKPTEEESLSHVNQPKSLRSRAEELLSPFQEEATVPEVESSCHIDVRPASLLTSTVLNSMGTNLNSPLSKEDQSFHNNSGTCLSLSAADDEAVIPTASPSVEVISSQSAKLVESSVCLYLSPTPFIIDLSKVALGQCASTDCACESHQLCNCLDAELAPQRFRTSFELALDGARPDEVNDNKNTHGSTAAKVKPEDDLHDMKLAQRALFKYKQDLTELESLAEGLYSRHLEEGKEEGDGGMTDEERTELDSVRGLRRQVLEEVETMEGQLAQRMRLAITRTTFPDGLENSLRTTSEGSLEVIEDMVHLLEEQRSLRCMLQDLEVTHSHTSLSEASTIPDFSAVGNGDCSASYREEEAPDESDDKKGMMQALTEVRVELQQQREAARREMNSAVKEMRQTIVSELRQELLLDAQLFQRQLQAKDKEIEQLKTLLKEQQMCQDGE